MATGSGLDAQLGVAEEITWGTPVTAARFPEFISESLSMTPEWLEPTALRVGQKHKRSSRVRQSRRSVGGDLVVEHATRGMGFFWRHALGSPVTSPAQQAATTAYRQAHVPGDYRGRGMTVQVGRPEPGSGTVKPFTYTGCKVTGWAFSVRDQEVPQLTLTVDGRDELTGPALAVASFVEGAAVFDFSQATLSLGGVASTADGLTVVTGGAAVATIIREMEVNGETPMATERFGLGNAGLKAEQIENGTPTITGSFGAEFSQDELYDAFANNETIPVVMTLTGAPITDGGGATDLLRITMPACKMKGASPQVGGPDIIEMTTEFEAYHDETHPPIEVLLISADTAL